MLQFEITTFAVYKMSGHDGNNLETVVHAFYNVIGIDPARRKVPPVNATPKTVALNCWDEGVIDQVGITHTVDYERVIFKT